MRRKLGGGLALGVAVVGSIALATPVLAGVAEIVPLEGALSAEVVAPGTTVTASSVEPCTIHEGEPTELSWAMGSYDEAEPRVTGVAPLDADGHWLADFTAPDDTGEFVFFAVCGDDVGDGDQIGDVSELPAEVIEEGKAPLVAAGTSSEQGPLEYYELWFTVEEETTTTTAPPLDTVPVATPATPVVAEPTFTG